MKDFFFKPRYLTIMTSKMFETHTSLTTSYIRQRRQLTNGTITINGNNLSIPKVLAVSEDSSIQVNIDSKAVKEMRLNDQYLKQKLDDGLVIYGINTGYGGSSMFVQIT